MDPVIYSAQIKCTISSIERVCFHSYSGRLTSITQGTLYSFVNIFQHVTTTCVECGKLSICIAVQNIVYLYPQKSSKWRNLWDHHYGSKIDVGFLHEQLSRSTHYSGEGSMYNMVRLKNQTHTIRLCMFSLVLVLTKDLLKHLVVFSSYVK